MFYPLNYEAVQFRVANIRLFRGSCNSVSVFCVIVSSRYAATFVYGRGLFQIPHKVFNPVRTYRQPFVIADETYLPLRIAIYRRSDKDTLGIARLNFM